ncbi:MAG: hypothetical protein P4L84_01090 [Isosphaeraceae bacterium]|nr:hypothetical protein [Isosphaeraceae bacterium]
MARRPPVGRYHPAARTSFLSTEPASRQKVSEILRAALQGINSHVTTKTSYNRSVVSSGPRFRTRGPMVHQVIGAPVSGEDFYNREEEQRVVWERLENNSLLMLAPRRVGKTSLMHRLRDTSHQNGFLATFLSVQDQSLELGFVLKLYEAVGKLQKADTVLRRLADGPFGSFFGRIKKLGPVELAEAPRDEWRELGNALTLALDTLAGSWLLLVDELPVFVLSLVRQDPTGTRARDFLHWFRTLRQGPYDRARIRWFLAGSLGLDTVAARLDLSDTINDLQLTPLGPFSPSTAHTFLVALGKTYHVDLSVEVRERILERIGWPIPYYLQLMFSELHSRQQEGAAAPTVATVDEAFEELLSPSKKMYFDYWRQRLGEELGRPDDGFANLLLTKSARDERGASLRVLRQALGAQITDPDQRDQKLRYLLDVLLSDGYLVEHEERFVFRSPLLRAFWLRRAAR